MPARGYEFYLLVFNSTSHSFAALTREMSSSTLEDKILIHARSCNRGHVTADRDKKTILIIAALHTTSAAVKLQPENTDSDLNGIRTHDLPALSTELSIRLSTLC